MHGAPDRPEATSPRRLRTHGPPTAPKPLRLAGSGRTGPRQLRSHFASPAPDARAPASFEAGVGSGLKRTLRPCLGPAGKFPARRAFPGAVEPDSGIRGTSPPRRDMDLAMKIFGDMRRQLPARRSWCDGWGNFSSRRQPPHSPPPPSTATPASIDGHPRRYRRPTPPPATATPASSDGHPRRYRWPGMASPTAGVPRPTPRMRRARMRFAPAGLAADGGEPPRSSSSGHQATKLRRPPSRRLRGGG